MLVQEQAIAALPWLLLERQSLAAFRNRALLKVYPANELHAVASERQFHRRRSLAIFPEQEVVVL